MSLHSTFNLSCDGSMLLPDGKSVVSHDCFAGNRSNPEAIIYQHEHSVARARLTRAPGPGETYVLSNVQLPKGWMMQEDGRTLCPACAEKLATARMMHTEPPKADAARVQQMKEIDAGKGDEFVVKLREEIQSSPALDVPMGSTQVQAWRDGRVVVRDNHDERVKLELKHVEWKLVDVPPFVDPNMIKTIAGLLATVQRDLRDDVPKGSVVLPTHDGLGEALNAMHKVDGTVEAMISLPLVARQRALGTLITKVLDRSDPAEADIIRRGMNDQMLLQELAKQSAERERKEQS